MKKINFFFIFIFCAFLLNSCSNVNNKSNVENNKDTLYIAVDSSLKVAINEHKKAFENSSKNLIIELVN